MIGPQGPIRPRVSQRAYNRWRVAYTLIRNEQLIVSVAQYSWHQHIYVTNVILLQDFTAYNLRKRRKSLKARMDHLYPVGNDSVKNNEADGLETEFWSMRETCNEHDTELILKLCIIIIIIITDIYDMI